MICIQYDYVGEIKTCQTCDKKAAKVWGRECTTDDCYTTGRSTAYRGDRSHSRVVHYGSSVKRLSSFERETNGERFV